MDSERIYCLGEGIVKESIKEGEGINLASLDQNLLQRGRDS